MKELENIQQDKLGVQQEAPVLTQLVKFGSLKRQPGQKVFEMNVQTFMVCEIAPDYSVSFESQQMKGRIDMKPGHLYCVALNAKNAVRKFGKMLGVKVKVK